MSGATLQLILTVVAGLLIASMVAIVKWVTGKADKTQLVKLEGQIEASADKSELSRLEVKLDAALLVVGAAISRPELAEKLLGMTGRNDDRMARVLADIVQLSTDAKANFKAIAETDKKLDDLPSRVRSLEEGQKRN